ncbi:uncharacterized protein LOC120644044 isoform X1 [Panicum virgatum]|uniref:uncharacterized protein LOC120644044 isoform X1 n=1 Tax=Panicum virgatum TaxID=38727 RepID=UPI0019D615EB|nr:uncharacterized protein LOC120644044 isoform X1 [Panicum virgatum]
MAEDGPAGYYVGRPMNYDDQKSQPPPATSQATGEQVNAQVPVWDGSPAVKLQNRFSGGGWLRRQDDWMSLIVWDDGEIIQIFSFEDFLFRQWRCQIVQAYADAE